MNKDKLAGIGFLNAFSLAEMLLVLLILSFLSIGIAPFAVKKVAKKSGRAQHGRFECFWQGDTLMQYTVYENGISNGPNPAPGNKCSFTTPEKAAFFIIQAIGGGGGGAYISREPEIFTASDNGHVEMDPLQISATSPSMSGSYNLDANCVKAGTSGKVACDSWLRNVWTDYPPTITAVFCAAAGRGGSSTCETLENEGLVCASGGSGGNGGCANGHFVAVVDDTFSWNGTTFGSTQVTCTVSRGQNGSKAPDHRTPGANGADGTLTDDGNGSCVAVTSTSTGGAGGSGSYGLAGNYSGVLGSSGGAASVAISNVSYQRLGKKITNEYGYKGESADFISMFFPVLDADMEIIVGKGGKGGQSISNYPGKKGEDTIIKFGDTAAEQIVASGGRGVSATGSSTFWVENLHSPDARGSELAPPRFASGSTFISFIELDESSKMPSKIPYDDVGSAGNGAYSIIRDTAVTEKLSLNDAAPVDNVIEAGSNKSEAYNCISDKNGAIYTTLPASSSKYSVCPAQDGRPGAVVILW